MSNSDSESKATTPTGIIKDDLSAPNETIHYISPASTRILEPEDFDYQQLGAYYDIFTQSDVLPPGSSKSSTVLCDEFSYQRTVAIVKPEAMIFKDVVLRAIVNRGFLIINQRTIHLTPEQVTEIYAQQYGCPSFPNTVITMSVGPLLVLSMARRNAIEEWKDMIGNYNVIREEWFVPLSVRRRFGIHADIEGCLHASDNIPEAAKENRYFFPDPILEPITDDLLKVRDYCNMNINPTLVDALVELCRVKPVEPIMFLAEWLLTHNPFKPKLPYKTQMVPT